MKTTVIGIFRNVKVVDSFVTDVARNLVDPNSLS